MMRTTLDIEKSLVDEVVRTTGEKSRSKAVNRALEIFVKARKIQELREMAGTIEIVDNLPELKQRELKEQDGLVW